MQKINLDVPLLVDNVEELKLSSNFQIIRAHLKINSDIILKNKTSNEKNTFQKIDLDVLSSVDHIEENNLPRNLINY